MMGRNIFENAKRGEINEPPSHYKVAPFYFISILFHPFLFLVLFLFSFLLLFFPILAPFLVMSLVIRLPLSHFLRGNLFNILWRLYSFHLKDSPLVERVIVISILWKGFSENSPGFESVRTCTLTIFSLLEWIWLKSLLKAIFNFLSKRVKWFNVFIWFI